MPYNFERQWQLARGHESKGDLVAAKDAYQAILRLEPDRLFVRLHLSNLEQATGHYRASREHALKAAETVRQGGRLTDLAAGTRRLLAFDERELVHALIIEANWNDPGILRDSAMLSQHLWLTDNFQDALRLIDVASLRAPSSHVLSYSRAHALRCSGRLEDATAEYERCLQLSPNYADAHWSLAYHQKATSPGIRIDRITRARQAHAEHAPEQAYLSYALFKEYDDAGETRLAWSHLQAGAGIKRASIRYDSSREEQGFVALEQMATRDFVRSGVRDHSSDRVPIFIVGLPRTGTTVLERILGGHSQITAGGELNDFSSALCREADAFAESAITTASVDRMHALDYSRIGRTYLERTLRKADGNSYLVDKNPANFVHAASICKALPQARIICLDRAPMDACLSNLKELFSGDAYGYSYDLDELADHYLRFHRLARHWQQVPPSDQVLVVDYETLVSDPSALAEQVMAFCGVPFEPACIDITSNHSPVSTASSSQVRTPINAKGVGAWRRYASQLQPLQDRIEATLTTLNS